MNPLCLATWSLTLFPRRLKFHLSNEGTNCDLVCSSSTVSPSRTVFPFLSHRIIYNFYSKFFICIREHLWMAKMSLVVYFLIHYSSVFHFKLVHWSWLDSLNSVAYYYYRYYSLTLSYILACNWVENIYNFLAPCPIVK